MRRPATLLLLCPAWKRVLGAAVLSLAAILAGNTFVAATADARQSAASHRKGKAALHRARHRKARRQTSSRTSSRERELAGPAAPARSELLAADPALLARVGHHLIVGYESQAAIRALVEKRAVAGIFLTDHNVRSRSAAEIKAFVDEMQAIRAGQGLPPLIVAADQEGGFVERLSPPLKRQASLGHVLAKAKDDGEREALVRAYAAEQAAELKSIGVTMNFAPVADLNLKATRRDDGETQLALRALATEPELVAKIAGWYCDVLAETGLMCTLKHFPGLGRVGNDTHKTMGEIRAAESQLRVRDWVPFIALKNRPHAAMMLAHVRLVEVDKDAPASSSPSIIGGILREGWQHDGMLITDDFSMGAVTRAKGGAGAAAVRAINAGADLVLVSFNERDLNGVLAALIKAGTEGTLDEAMLEKSRGRVARILKQSNDFAQRQ